MQRITLLCRHSSGRVGTYFRERTYLQRRSNPIELRFAPIIIYYPVGAFQNMSRLRSPLAGCRFQYR